MMESGAMTVSKSPSGAHCLRWYSTWCSRMKAEGCTSGYSEFLEIVFQQCKAGVGGVIGRGQSGKEMAGWADAFGLGWAVSWAGVAPLSVVLGGARGW